MICFKTRGVWLILTAGLWSQHCFQVNLGNCPGMNCFHGGSQETFKEAPLLQRQPAGMEKEEEFAHFLRRIFVSDACRACSFGTFCFGLFNPIFSSTISSSATRLYNFSFLQDLPQIQNNSVTGLALDAGSACDTTPPHSQKIHSSNRTSFSVTVCVGMDL